jgi:mRNA-degrading endonuclease RelE of RelBE toxin-antitoxin system
VTSKGKKWRITKIANSARKNILHLEPESQKVVLHQLEALELNPYGCDVKKIAGKKNVFRVRIGNYRLYFRLIKSTKFIEILMFDARGRIKQKNIQRLKN